MKHTSLLAMWTTILPIGFPIIGTRQSQLTLNTATSSSSSPGRSKRLRPVGEHDDDRGDNSGSGNPKRQRNMLYHPQRVHCLPCALWSQSGSDANLQHFHPLNNSRHVGSDAVPLSRYTQYNTTTFYLTSGDCINLPCYKDFKRKQDHIPRWAKLQLVSGKTNTAFTAVMGMSVHVKLYNSGAQISGVATTHPLQHGRSTF